MSNEEPFRSRPRVTRRPPEPEASPPDSSPDAEADDDIIEGVMEEETPRRLVAHPPRTQEPINLPADSPFAEEDEPPAGGQLRPGLMLVAIGLFIGGVFVTLLNVADLPDVIEQWWPLSSLIVALGWSFIALLRRDVAAFLAGATVVGLSLSLLLDAQDISRFQETAVGIILMSFGLAIVMRGLLLRSVRT